MKVFETKWIQENSNTVEKALIIPKSITVSRSDTETYIHLDKENDSIEWRSKLQITTVYEVYPDENSFHKRVYPIAMFRKTFYQPLSTWGTEDMYSQSLDKLIRDTTIPGQDFTHGTIITIDVKEVE